MCSRLTANAWTSPAPGCTLIASTIVIGHDVERTSQTGSLDDGETWTCVFDVNKLIESRSTRRRHFGSAPSIESKDLSNWSLRAPLK